MTSGVPKATRVAGATIRWGQRGEGPDLVLVHGNGAHHGWWDGVADLLEPRWRLTVLDLSGHGDSDHRPSYTTTHWSTEVRRVLEVAGIERAVLVGHSMGGRVVLKTGATDPSRLAGIMMLDAGIRPPELFRDFSDYEPARGTSRTYDSKEEAISRFRLVPAQPVPSPEDLVELAARSVVETDQGWRFKHDPQVIMLFTDQEVDELAGRLSVPLGYVYSAHSPVVNARMAAYAEQRVPAQVIVRRLEDVHHHMILDGPRHSAAVIEELAARFFATAEGVA